MSLFKKMKLVPDVQSNKNKNDLKSVIDYETSTNIRKMNDLDDEMKKILNSDLDEYTKSKLYSESLRKFILFKKLDTQSDSVNRIPVCLEIDSENSSVKKKNNPIKQRIRKRNKKADANKSIQKRSKRKLEEPIKKKNLKSKSELSDLFLNLIEGKNENESIWEEFSNSKH